MNAASAQQRIRVFCALCIARCGAIAVVEDGRFARPRTRSRASDRPGAMRQGPRRAGTRLPPGPADASAAAHPAEGRPRSRLAAHRLGRGARPDRRRHAPDRRAARPAERSPSPVSPSTTAIGDSSGFIRRLMQRVRHPERARSARSVRLGPRLRHPLHLRRRQRRHRRRRRRDAGHRATPAA